MIYYSHVNEDNLLEKTRMDHRNFETLYIVAGSGERVLSLLGHTSLRKVKMIDINQEALFLLELKLKALEYLTPSEYLDFIGLNEQPISSAKKFDQFCNQLSGACKSYWKQNSLKIEKGILFCGAFEQFLNRSRPFIQFAVGQGFYQYLDNKESKLSKLSKLRWNFLKSVFKRKIAYRFLGLKDPAFISASANPKYIVEALQKTMDNQKVASSWMFHLIFYGNLLRMNKIDMPISLDLHYLEKLKNKLLSKELEIEYIRSDLFEYLDNHLLDHPGNSFYSISDVLSFENMGSLDQLLDKILSLKGGHHTLIARAFLKNRISKDYIKSCELKGLQCTDLSAHERSNMYQVIEFEKV